MNVKLLLTNQHALRWALTRSYAVVVAIILTIILTARQCIIRTYRRVKIVEQYYTKLTSTLTSANSMDKIGCNTNESAFL